MAAAMERRSPRRTHDAPVASQQHRLSRREHDRAVDRRDGQSLPLAIWMTFKQAINLGGAVRKGEKGSLIVYVPFYEH